MTTERRRCRRYGHKASKIARSSNIHFRAGAVFKLIPREGSAARHYGITEVYGPIEETVSSIAANHTPPSDTTDPCTVAVVITTYNHAHYLGQAIDSVIRQSRSADAIIVVDDGSGDDPACVVARYPQVRLIRHENRGLAAARNTGLAAAGTKFILFLDADDLLEPIAIASGLDCFAANPACGFVYGGHRHVDGEGAALWGPRFEPIGDRAFERLLRGNCIAMHATVLYRTQRLLAAGGFDPTLRKCEDYDVYLRMTQTDMIAGHDNTVALYRWHGANMSSDAHAMLHASRAVHARQAASAARHPATQRAWREGRRNWRNYYGAEMAKDYRRNRMEGLAAIGALPELVRLTRSSPRQAAGALRFEAEQIAKKLLPGRLQYWLRRTYIKDAAPPLGHVRLGDLTRTTPISRDFGFDRGLPIDRHYVEDFLSRHASDIAGRVLEIGDDAYTRQFGGAKVTKRDVLHVHTGNPHATFVGDLTGATVLPPDTFDCMVLTQTLHLIYDFRLAVERIHRALKPDGVLLLTVPGITPIDRGEWGASWFWSFTPAAVARLFGDVFGRNEITVEHYGNVFAATAFLQGLAVEEIRLRDLAPVDEAYPVIVAVHARKRLSE